MRLTKSTINRQAEWQLSIVNHSIQKTLNPNAQMKRFLIVTFSILLCTITMSAQNFTDHLQSTVSGQGTVTVHQDSLLDDIVNGKKSWLTVRAMEKGAKGVAEALEADLSPAEKIATVMDLYDSVHVAEDAREAIARFHEKALAAASKVTGIGGYEVELEVYISSGLPRFDIVGLPDAAVREAGDRAQAAGATPTWDGMNGLNFSTWEADGATYLLWYENVTSVTEKMNAVEDYGIAGIAVWSGSWWENWDDAEVWNVFRTSLGA